MKRYYWILMTYVTRPMTWAVALCAIGLISAAIFNHSDRYTNVDLPIITADSPIIDTRTSLAEFSESSDPVQIRLSRVLSSDLADLAQRKRDSTGESFVHITDEEITEMLEGVKENFSFPKNVVALSTGGHGPDFLDEISKLKSLKRLKFDFSYSGDPLNVESLANLKNLEMLELGAIHKMDSLLPLSKLTKLHTVKVSHNGVITEERMAELAQVPALKHLYLPDVSADESSRRAITELEQSKSLETLYVEVPLSQPEMLSKIQAQVPTVKVRSSTYRTFRLLVFAGMMWFGLMLSFSANHIIGQFSSPQSQIVPAYQKIHVRFTIVLIVALVVAVSLVASLLSGAHFVQMLIAFGIAIAWLIHSSTRLSPTQTPSFGTMLVRVVVLGLGIATIVFSFKSPMVLEEFLMIRWPTAGVFAAAVAAGFLVWLTTRRLRGLCRERYAMGLPLCLSMQDFQKNLQQFAQRGKSTDEGSMDPSARFESAMRFVGILVAGLVLARFVFGEQIFGSRGLGAMIGGQAIGYSVALSFLLVGLIGAKWWHRMPFMATMITRPPNREIQIESILKGVRKDFLSILPPAYFAVLVIAATAPIWSTENLIVRTIVSAAFLLSLILFCYAAVLWGLIIRTFVGLFAFGFFLQFGVTFIIALITMVGLELRFGIPVYRVAMTSVFLLVSAWIAISSARKKYQQFEWGSLL